MLENIEIAKDYHCMNVMLQLMSYKNVLEYRKTTYLRYNYVNNLSASDT